MKLTSSIPLQFLVESPTKSESVLMNPVDLPSNLFPICFIPRLLTNVNTIRTLLPFPSPMMIYSFEQYDKKAHSFQMYFLLPCKIRSTSRRRTQFPRFCIFLFVFFVTSRNLHSAVRLDTVGRITDWKFTRRLISYSWKASWVFVRSRRSLRYRILATESRPDGQTRRPIERGRYISPVIESLLDCLANTSAPFLS